MPTKAICSYKLSGGKEDLMAFAYVALPVFIVKRRSFQRLLDSFGTSLLYVSYSDNETVTQHGKNPCIKYYSSLESYTVV